MKQQTCSSCGKPYYLVCRSCFARGLEDRFARQMIVSQVIAKATVTSPIGLDNCKLLASAPLEDRLHGGGAF